ncbi:MAG: YdcF family protein [Bacteroidales bacterium]|nr:YdcF family protein [Bacteroidales bacterium]
MKRLLLRTVIFIFVLVFITIWICDRVIVSATDNKVFSEITKLPHNRVGLLLGTSKLLGSGKPNQYFSNRIKAAVELFEAGKIDFIVISGDNSRAGYNEPLDMKNELIRMGIPEEKIFLDYAGFRTYDSVIRMEKIFGQKNFTIISQEFHNRRAAYIAGHFGQNAVGYSAADVDVYNGFKTKVREKIARTKVFLDFLFHKQPKFLGEPVEIK